MAQLPLNKVMEYIRRVAGAPGGGDGTDGQLLERYVEQHDETAFSALMQRHGPLVLGLCRRVVGDAHHAEDAFQATFLVLARKAGTIASHELLAQWLYGVAYRVAARVRVRVGRLQAREKPLEDREVQTVGINSAAYDDPSWGELGPVLDAEVNRLSRKYRQAVVLCCLEGKSKAEAARQLGCPEGTVSSRLVRARELLQKRLLRRGVAPTAGVLAAALAPGAGSAAVPAGLANATIKAATLFAAGKAAAAGISAHIVTLAEGALQAMFMTKLKIAAVVLLSLGLAGGATGVAMHQVLAEKEEPGKAEAAKPALAQNGDPGKPKAEKPQADGKEQPVKEGVRPKEVQLEGIGKDQLINPVFSPDAKLVAGVIWRENGRNKELLPTDLGLGLWDAITGKKLRTLEVGSPAVFSPDGKLLVVNGWNSESESQVTIWQTATGKEVARFPRASVPTGCGCFFPDGKGVVTVNYSERAPGSNLPIFDSLQFREIASGKELFRIPVNLDGVNIDSMAFSPDGKLLAATYPVWSRTPPGSKIPSAKIGAVLVVWEIGMDSGKEFFRIPYALKWPQEIEFGPVVFSPDGKTLRCGNILWDVATRKKTTTNLTGPGSLAGCPVFCSPNGKFLGLVGQTINGHTNFTHWEADSGKLLGSFLPFGPTSRGITAIFLTDGKNLLTVGREGVIKRWDLSDLPRNLPGQKKK